MNQALIIEALTHFAGSIEQHSNQWDNDPTTKAEMLRRAEMAKQEALLISQPVIVQIAVCDSVDGPRLYGLYSNNQVRSIDPDTVQTIQVAEGGAEALAEMGERIAQEEEQNGDAPSL